MKEKLKTKLCNAEVPLGSLLILVRPLNWKSTGNTSWNSLNIITGMKGKPWSVNHQLPKYESQNRSQLLAPAVFPSWNQFASLIHCNHSMSPFEYTYLDMLRKHTKLESKAAGGMAISYITAPWRNHSDYFTSTFLILRPVIVFSTILLLSDLHTLHVRFSCDGNFLFPIFNALHISFSWFLCTCFFAKAH